MQAVGSLGGATSWATDVECRPTPQVVFSVRDKVNARDRVNSSALDEVPVQAKDNFNAPGRDLVPGGWMERAVVDRA